MFLTIKNLLFVAYFLSGILFASDPFIWLEEANSEKTHKWKDAQQEKTMAFFSLAQNEGDKKAIENLSNFSVCGLPEISENGLFYLKRHATEEKFSLTFLAPNQKQRALLVPLNDQTIAITQFEPSPSEKLVIYGTSESGSDGEK